jgi:hypothetical protein
LVIGRLINFFKVISGNVFFHRNTHNMPTLWKRALVFLPWYLLSIIFAIFVILFLGSLLAGICRLTAKRQRKLTVDELSHLTLCPNDLVYLKTVTIIECSRMAIFGKRSGKRKQLGIGIASTIHFCRNIDTDNSSDLKWLVHEVAHTLQYKYRGLVYIPEALIAQRFSGYGFGGKEVMDGACVLRTFNPEQQAEIFMLLSLSGHECQLVQEIKKGNW